MVPHAAIMSLEAAGNENKFRRSKEDIFVMERKQKEKRKWNREKEKDEERMKETFMYTREVKEPM